MMQCPTCYTQSCAGLLGKHKLNADESSRQGPKVGCLSRPGAPLFLPCSPQLEALPYLEPGQKGWFWLNGFLESSNVALEPRFLYLRATEPWIFWPGSQSPKHLWNSASSPRLQTQAGNCAFTGDTSILKLKQQYRNVEHTKHLRRDKRL